MADADAARTRFDDSAREHLSAPLVDGISMRTVDAAEFNAVCDALWAAEARPHADVAPLYRDREAETADLGAVVGAGLAHRVLFEQGGELVGCYWGQQDASGPPGRYYMVNTIFRRDVQGRGLYSRLLPRVIAAADGAGFTEVWSRHRADNNAILVPKLKAGFVITGFEIAPKFGVLIHLRRYLVDGVAKLYRARIDDTHGEEMRAAGVMARR
jgi:hypothetical protein